MPPTTVLHQTIRLYTVLRQHQIACTKDPTMMCISARPDNLLRVHIIQEDQIQTPKIPILPALREERTFVNPKCAGNLKVIALYT